MTRGGLLDVRVDDGKGQLRDKEEDGASNAQLHKRAHREFRIVRLHEGMRYHVRGGEEEKKLSILLSGEM